MAKAEKNKYFEGVGSRKTSTARVRIYEGEGTSTINGKPFKVVYPGSLFQERLLKPLVVAGLKDKFYFTAKAVGGGIAGQLDAVVLGLARAIVNYDETNKPALRNEGVLTRDPRQVERKKYFLRKARKRPQFSKR